MACACNIHELEKMKIPPHMHAHVRKEIEAGRTNLSYNKTIICIRKYESEGQSCISSLRCWCHLSDL